MNANDDVVYKECFCGGYKKITTLSRLVKEVFCSGEDFRRLTIDQLNTITSSYTSATTTEPPLSEVSNNNTNARVHYVSRGSGIINTAQTVDRVTKQAEKLKSCES